MEPPVGKTAAPLDAIVASVVMPGTIRQWCGLVLRGTDRILALGKEIRMEDADRRRLALSAAGFLKLRIDPSLLAGVVTNLALLQQHAGRVMEFELPLEEAMACQFHA